MTTNFPYYWRLRKTLPERKGQPCRLIATGKMNSALIEFEDGTKHVVNRYAVRKHHEDQNNLRF